ncbi:MAG TPA: hypothetical protein VF903_00105 [Nitrospirota bacterium]
MKKQCVEKSALPEQESVDRRFNGPDKKGGSAIKNGYLEFIIHNITNFICITNNFLQKLHQNASLV